MKRNQRLIKRLLYALVISFLGLVLVLVYNSLTDDFRLCHIYCNIPYHHEWSVEPVSKDIENQVQEILKQPFYYIAKGAQSYVFASQDDLYVLKFFKFKHLRPASFLNSIPSFHFLNRYKKKVADRKERKLYGVFRGYKLAYDVNKTESGLIFIQLNIQNNPKRQVRVIDKIGLSRIVNLENVAFIIQEKGSALNVLISDLIKKGEVSKAKECISQIFDLVGSEYRKGIYDHDHHVMRNMGFVGNRPIHFDVGKLVSEESILSNQKSRNDAILIGANMKTWMEKKIPENSDEMSKFIDEKISQLFD